MDLSNVSGWTLCLLKIYFVFSCFVLSNSKSLVIHDYNLYFSYIYKIDYAQREASNCCGDGVACDVNSHTHRTIHWFKKGLRLHDNAALLHAISTSKVSKVNMID